MSQSATEFVGPGQGGLSPQALSPSGAVARSPRQLFWARFKDDKLAIFGAGLILMMIMLALSAGIWETQVVHHPFDEQYVGSVVDGVKEPLMLSDFGTPLGPNKQFWMGADDLGRDLFVRVLYGARVSLKIAIVATGIEVVIGVVVGMLAGFFKGWIDTVMSRFMDLILSIPFLLLGIALSVVWGGGEGIVIFLISFFGWPYIARIVRGQVLSLRESQFVEAAYSIGASSRFIMFREILPNLVAPIIIYATLIIPVNILGEAALSFLGVGVQEPTPAWGTMLARATGYVSYGAAWWYMFYPGLALFLTVLGFNLLGDGLRDSLDPKTGR
ncbi:MAG: ABC transporter permease [Actinomycetota bacterium]